MFSPQLLLFQHSLPPIPPPASFFSPNDAVMLEDESGRIKLVGDVVKNAGLVTGAIVAALGAETANGDFEVIELAYAGLAAPPVYDDAESEDKMDVDGK
jgi:DNA polymerase delta subunit 2